MKTYPFGTSRAFCLENDLLKVTLISFGARITNLEFCGKDLVIGYDDLEGFQNSTVYPGAIIDRYANRIANGRFELNGKVYQLGKNENDVTNLHGGPIGFDMMEWDSTVESENSVSFSRISPDGEMGFPGTVRVKVTYTLEEDALKIDYDADTDADTFLSLTNHVYFNLDGYDGEDCRNMKLMLRAPWYLPVDDKLIPSGEIRSVSGTVFDFTEEKTIGTDFDHCFVLGMDRKYQNAGRLYSEKTGIAMEIETDMPSVQFYSSGFLSDTVGKGGIPLHLHQAVALETQLFPDSPNHDNFPSTLLKPGEKFKSTTRYRFSKVQ